MYISEIASIFKLTEQTIKNWIKIGLLPDKEDFTSEEIESVISSKNHSRRNKKKSLNFSIPESYIKNKNTVKLIEEILEFQQDLQYDFNHIFSALIKKLLGERINTVIENHIKEIFGDYNRDLFLESQFDELDITYDSNEDFLGALYSSSLTIGNKTTNGIFYTPFSVVINIVNSINDTMLLDDYKIVDPACGSGNFIISIINRMKSLGYDQKRITQAVYGYDVDNIAVFIAKINVYLLLDNIEFDEINIFKKDFLLSEIKDKFNVVIGNPPWGAKFSSQYKNLLQNKLYYNAPKQDSFALFIEKSLEILLNHGQLFFVLPVSFLNVAKHQDIRKKCLKYKIISIKNLGREFSEVVTENLVLQLEKSELLDAKSSLLYNDKIIEQSYFNQNPAFSFLVADNSLVQAIIDKINNNKFRNLKENVKFGMGIVTGNNRKFIISNKNKSNEHIATGKNLAKYYVNAESIDKFIVFNPDLYQQVAPIEIYRHKSRILYNFIGKKIKFSYDQTGLLTLNSANIICLYEGWDPYYVLGILNSRITQIYYQNIFKTYKMLRSHIEAFRIFEFDDASKKKISDYVKDMVENKHHKNHEFVENLIYEKLGLTSKEINYLYENF